MMCSKYTEKLFAKLKKNVGLFFVGFKQPVCYSSVIKFSSIFF